MNALLKRMEERERRILPHSSNIKEMREFRKEAGSLKAIAVQYGDDLKAAEFNEDERMWFINNIGPNSSHYVAISTFEHQERISLLRSLHGKVTKTESSSDHSPRTKSCKRMKGGGRSKGEVPRYTFPLQFKNNSQLLLKQTNLVYHKHFLGSKVEPKLLFQFSLIWIRTCFSF